MHIDSRRLHATAFAAALLTIGISCSSDTSAPVPVATIAITPPSGNVNVGSTLAFTVELQDAHGKVLTGRPISFTSSDTNMATVSASGTVTGIALYYYPKATLPLIKQYMAEGNNPDQPGRLIQWLYPRTPVYTWRVPGLWFDIGSKESLTEANTIFAQHRR